jgi:hypothetical protein
MNRDLPGVIGMDLLKSPGTCVAIALLATAQLLARAS